jgi:protein-disulfide isomerase
VAAARVAIAAGFQGAYEPVHMHLMRTVLPPGPGPIRRLAERFALDPEQLAVDTRSARVTAELDRSKAVASVFGLFGTPSIIVGSTIVIGYIRKQSMHELIEIEHETPLSGRVCTG